MAKKLNKKVVIGIIALVLVIGGGLSILIGPKVARRLGIFQYPDKALAKAQQFLEAGDYENAEKKFKQAYIAGKTDEYKIDRLFDLAEFHLINNDRHEADWSMVMSCWNQIITIDTQNIAARRKLLDFYYQAAEAGDARSWRTVKENTTELIDILQAQGTKPDTFLLTANAKALLSIAQRGDTTDRRGPLDECVALLNQLIEKEPQNGELYKLMADATIVEGELNALAGVIDAKEKAQEKAMSLLETGLEQSDDKATAVADLMLYKMQTALSSDPNALEAIRAEIDERSKQVQPNDKLWLVTSVAYETPGKMSAESEINRAIEAIRQAHKLKPDDFEYTLRMARLLYRKGNAFNDPPALDDALQIAEDALSLEEVQDVPGPLQGRNLNYRFVLNNFLADLYLEKALAAKDADKEAECHEFVRKAQERVEEIIGTLGSTDNPMAQKYQGLIALAEGQQGKAVQLLYKAYEAGRALDMDKPGERSSVDSRVCIALARIAGQQGQFGLQNEFLRGAFRSRDGYVQKKPQLLLEYAEVLKRLRAWGVVMQLTQNYQTRYGANEQSQRLEIEASIALGEFDKAKELLSSYEGTPAEKSRYELSMLVTQTDRLKRTIASLKEQKEEPSSEQAQELKMLREKRNERLVKILETSPKEVNAQILAGICVDLLQNSQRQFAVQCLDTYLAANPDVLNLMVLRLQAQQEDPLNLTPEQRMGLQEQAINSLTDAKQKAILLAEFHRSQGDYEKAMRVLEQNPQVNADDPDIVLLRFEVVLEQKEFQAAESLQQTIRTENLDQCEGNLAAARLEIVKENYQLASRRLDECLLLRPLSSYSYFLKSQVLGRLEDEEGAIKSAKTAIRMDPQNASYMRQLASLLFARNAALGSKLTVEQQAEAEQAIMMSMRLNPLDQQLQSVYAESIQEKDPDRALLIRQKLLENNPNASNALMLGRMALRMAQSEWDAAKKTGLIELAGTAYQQGMVAEPGNETLRQAYADYQQRTGKEDAIELLGGDKNLEWKFYLRGGQFEQAEAILKELLQGEPDDPLLIQGLVLVSQGAGNRDQVKEYLEMLSELDETKETELWILQKYIDNGFTVEAEKKLESFKERFPDEKAALLVEAWTQMGKGRLDEALILANGYLETDTNNPGAWRLRGRLYRLMNQPRKAIDDLQHSKGLQDTSAVRMELATVYTELKQTTAAIGELVSSLDDPQSPVKMRLMLEGLYRKSGRSSDLEKLYQSTQEKYPKNPFWYYRAGVYYLVVQKQFAKAQDLLEKAWELSLESKRPSLEIFDYYLDSLFQGGQHNRAMTVASSQIDTPLASVAYTYMGQIQFASGQKEKAVESFGKALDKAGNADVLGGIMRIMLGTVGEDAVTAWISKGLAGDGEPLSAHMLAASLAQGKNSYNEAIEHIDRCIEIVGQDSPAWLGYALKKVNLLIMVYVKTGDLGYMTRATDLLATMLKVQPNNASLLNNMAYLLVDNDQQLETALDYARKAHQSDPGNAIYLDTYAYAQCKTGRYEQAEQNLLRAVQIYEASGQPVPWDLYKHFAMTKEGLGETEQAIEMYQKALDASDQIPEKEKQQLQAAIERLQQA